MKSTDNLKPVRVFSAELFGTTILALVAGTVSVMSSYGVESFGPIMIGLVVAILVYVVGPVSGAHFNPAVTVAQMVFKKIKPINALLYVIAQIIGAMLGIQIARYFTGSLPANQVPSTVAAVAETLGALILVFTIVRAVLGKIAPPMSGLAIGGALTIAITIAAPTGGGVLNPAVALALQSYSWVYLIMPFIGGILGAALAIFFESSATNE
jgi:aquaporin Z